MVIDMSYEILPKVIFSFEKLENMAKNLWKSDLFVAIFPSFPTPPISKHSYVNLQ